MQQAYIIGVSGGSGSGKTYLLKQLTQQVGADNITTISLDNYYRPQEEQPIDSDGIVNFDRPESIDNQLFAKHLRQLREGKTVEIEEYTFNNPNAKPKLLTFTPAPVIILEGLYVFHFEETAKLIDLRIFVDTRPELMIKRRILRDNVERGYSIEDVLYRYEHHVIPAFDEFIHKHRHQADVVLPNYSGFDRFLDMFVPFVKSKAN